MSISVIRAIYAAGAIFDAAIAALMLLPNALAMVVGLAEVPSRLSERVCLAMASSLLFGWTGLLIWGLRSPVERRGVLLLTVFPVIMGLALAVLAGWSGSYISTAGAAMIWSTQSLFGLLFVWAFLWTQRAAKRREGAK